MENINCERNYSNLTMTKKSNGVCRDKSRDMMFMKIEDLEVYWSNKTIKKSIDNDNRK